MTVLAATELKVKIPRPSDIKITASKPSLEELKDYRDAWLEEGETNGIVNELFKVVKTLGVRGDQVHRGWEPMIRYGFSGGENDYVILYKTYFYHVGNLDYGRETIWERLLLVENGEFMKEIEFDNKTLVKFFRIAEPPTPNRIPPEAQKYIDQALFLPGDWELYFSPHIELSNLELSKIKKDKNKTERTDLIKRLSLGKGAT